MKSWTILGSAWVGLFALSACAAPATSNQGPLVVDSGGVSNGASAGAANSGGSAGTSLAAGAGGGSAGSGVAVIEPVDSGLPDGEGRPPAGACGLADPAFCETFEQPSPGGRGGDLDDQIWSVARISTGNNWSQGAFNSWPLTTASACGSETTGLGPDKDMFFCAGGPTASMHFNDSENDGGGFTIHSYRVRRPFDFSARTGIIAFDVGAKGQVPGGHGWWFNIMIADEPVPAPYQQGGGIALYARAAVGIEFEGGGGRTDCDGIDGTCNAVSNVFAEKDYAITQKYTLYSPGGVVFTTEEEVLNHVEIHISQSEVEVFVSDAGEPSTLRSVAKVDADVAPGLFPLPLTRGYVSLQQTHYNAAKTEILPAYTTYHWDNVGFDGPSFPAPRAYEVPDSLTMNRIEGVNTGYGLAADGLNAPETSSPLAITLESVDLTDAEATLISLNAWGFCPGDTIGYRLNAGEWREFDCPFPNSFGDNNNPAGTCDGGARAVVIPVELSDLQAGANTLELNSGSGTVLMANAELTIDTH